MLDKNAGHGLSCSLWTAREMLDQRKSRRKEAPAGQQRQEVEEHSELYLSLKSNIQVGKDTGNVSRKGPEEK